jgi:peptidyl-prolyl cis-trans isomerase SurA
MFRFVYVLVLTIGYVQATAQTVQKKSPVLFTIKKEHVTADEFIYIFKKNHPAKEDYTEKQIHDYLNLFINFKLKVTEAKQRGIDTTATFIKEYNSYKDELRKPYLPENKILDSLTKVSYERLKEEVRASHILITVKPDAPPADTLEAFNKALEIKTRALQHEDFSSLASLYSEDPSARMNKGDLGYFTTLQMVYTFEQAVYTAGKGDVVGPVRTRYGYHIIKVVDRKPARGEVEVSHIMIRTGERPDTEAKNIIFDIHDQLRAGMLWDDLCKKFSEDPGTKNMGGRLRPFGVQTMNAVPEFDRVAFSLQKPGEISDPFQTQYGWHIVRLEQKIPLPAWDDAYASLKNKVARDERVQISRAALMGKLKKEFLFHENTPAKTNVLALADTSLTKGAFKIPKTANEKDWLFSIRGSKISAAEFFRYIKRNQKATALTPEKYMEQLYHGFVEQHINNKLEEDIIQNNPDFKILLTEYYEGILLFDVMEHEVWKKASDDSIGQRKFFETNKNKYQAGERVSAEIYSASVKDAITALQQSIEQQDSLAITNALNSKAVRAERGMYQLTDRPVLAKVNWKKGTYVTENNGTHYLVKVNEVIPPGPMLFDEARAAVITDYQDNLEKQWITALRKKYPVKLNSKTKTYVVQKLSL